MDGAHKGNSNAQIQVTGALVIKYKIQFNVATIACDDKKKYFYTETVWPWFRNVTMLTILYLDL